MYLLTVTLAGMLEMSTMYLPVNQNWNKYLENCSNAFEDAQYVLKNLLEKTANDACKFIDTKSSDPWLFDLDWSSKELGLTKAGAKNKVNRDQQIQTVILNDDNLSENPFYKISSTETKQNVSNQSNYCTV